MSPSFLLEFLIILDVLLVFFWGSRCSRPLQLLILRAQTMTCWAGNGMLHSTYRKPKKKEEGEKNQVAPALGLSTAPRLTWDSYLETISPSNFNSGTANTRNAFLFNLHCWVDPQWCSKMSVINHPYHSKWNFAFNF